MKKVMGTYNEISTLNYKLSDVIASCLNGLEIFLKHLKEYKPHSIPSFIANLNTKYGTSQDYHVSVDSNYDNLTKYPELLKGSINYALSLVNYEKYNKSPIDKEMDIDAIDLIRTYTHFEYSFTVALIEAKIMSREEAIKYIQKMTNEITHLRTDPNNYVESFKDSIDRFQSGLGRWQMQTSIAKIVDKKRMLYKVNKCKWGELLRDFDRELCFSFLCYQDFEGTKNINPNFLLTRTKTILMGDDYCDFCYHDTRYDDDLTHPSEIEFEELG